MSNVLDTSPVGKKGRYSNAASSAPSSKEHDDFKVVGEVTDIDCIDQDCTPRGKLVKRRTAKGAVYFLCTRQGCPTIVSCLFAPRFNGKKTDNDDTSGRCLSCFKPVHGTLSLGKLVDEADKVYENIHVLHIDCLKKTVTNPASGDKVLVNATAASGVIVGKPCIAFTGEKCNDLTKGCTGVIKAGDLVVKGWATHSDPKGLHLRCGKRAWASKVQAILDERKFLKATGTTATDEATTPCAKIPANFEDF